MIMIKLSSTVNIIYLFMVEKLLLVLLISTADYQKTGIFLLQWYNSQEIKNKIDLDDIKQGNKFE